MLILVALLVAVVAGWIVLAPLILPGVAPADASPSAAAGSPGPLDGRWTATPDAPDRTTLAISAGTYAIEGQEAYGGSGRLAAVGSEVTVSADPACPTVSGRYAAELGETERYGLLPQFRAQTLELSVIDDPCADGARARALTEVPWVLRTSARSGSYGVCDPPNEEAAITGHWPIPTGCE
ncbi:MAG TPA: hypothetical protein VF367_04605 [Candidatus Limnocylindria bacterium]